MSARDGRQNEESTNRVSASALTLDFSQLFTYSGKQKSQRQPLKTISQKEFDTKKTKNRNLIHPNDVKVKGTRKKQPTALRKALNSERSVGATKNSFSRGLNPEVHSFEPAPEVRFYQLPQGYPVIRDYCTNLISNALNAEIESLLHHISQFNSRLRVEKPLQFKRRRWLVSGMREVQQLAKLGRLICVVFASNIEKISPNQNGILEHTIHSIAKAARATNTEVIYGPTRKKLAKSLGDKGQLSVVGILKSEGVHQEYRALIDHVERLREHWQQWLAAKRVVCHHCRDLGSESSPPSPLSSPLPLPQPPATRPTANVSSTTTQGTVPAETAEKSNEEKEDEFVPSSLCGFCYPVQTRLIEVEDEPSLSPHNALSIYRPVLQPKDSPGVPVG
eukprot:GCRY01003750.1.p1 GENE.GCRY01003750.1~~GCRY01003750.1.p1  ORF type:complete len:391 (-),score=54.69 GCRY01003750.1:1626-2798(-)